jgi:hypothetical protein
MRRLRPLGWSDVQSGARAATSVERPGARAATSVERPGVGIRNAPDCAKRRIALCVFVSV